jgi:hypothetical protein
MTAAAALDPAGPGDDAFVDALVGLAGVCRWLAGEAGEIERATVTAGTPGDAGADAPAAELDEPLAALLGLVSMRTTLSLVLAALCGDPADAEPEAGAAWSRELLR